MSTSTKEKEKLFSLDHSLSMQEGTFREQKIPYPIFLKETLLELWQFRFAFFTGVVNKLRKRYQRSVLGFAWSLLNPLISMVVLTVVFSLLFNKNPQSYAAYLITGLLPWAFMRDAIMASAPSIVEGEQFLKKVSIVPVYFPIVAGTTELVNFILSLISLSLLGGFIGLKLSPALLALPVVLALTFAFVIGLAITVSIANVYFRDLGHILGILINSMFYFTPIFYTLDQLPEQCRGAFLYNPFYYFVELFRIVVFENRVPGFGETLIPAVLALVSLTIATSIFYAKSRSLIYRL